MYYDKFHKEGMDRKPVCVCGKIGFSKKDALTKKNWLENKGRVRQLRIYQCDIDSNYYHLTKTKYYDKNF